MLLSFHHGLCDLPGIFCLTWTVRKVPSWSPLEYEQISVTLFPCKTTCWAVLCPMQPRHGSIDFTTFFFFSVYTWPVWIVADVPNSSCTLTETFFCIRKVIQAYFCRRGLFLLVTPNKLTEQEGKKKVRPELHIFFTFFIRI